MTNLSMLGTTASSKELPPHAPPLIPVLRLHAIQRATVQILLNLSVVRRVAGAVEQLHHDHVGHADQTGDEPHPKLWKFVLACPYRGIGDFQRQHAGRAGRVIGETGWLP